MAMSTGAARTGSHLDDLLGPWIPHQRWYPAKGREARMRQVGRLVLPSTDGAGAADAHEDGGVVVLVHVVELTGAHTEVVQVPLVHRAVARTDEGADAALVGVLAEADGRTWHVYDGPRDPAFVDALLALLAGRVRALGVPADSPVATALDARERDDSDRDDGGDRDDGDDLGGARGVRSGEGAVPQPGSPSRVLRGEQSNTSIIVEPAGAPPVIVKVFRTLHAGDNPDVEVQAALAAAGSDRVPRPAGWVEGRWPDGSGALVRGHLAVAAEFLAGAQDAWREATAAVAAGRDFTGQARDLGAATAQVHEALARALPARPATAQDAADLAAGLRRRAEWALESAPVLADRADALRAAVAALGELPSLPDLQRVHGDYHLGQVLSVPDRGWVLLDFEGEPLRPLAERTLPDLALRDVAGMLRSFDYAARQATAGTDDPERLAAAQAWAAAARDAFCAGYAGVAGRDPREDGALLDALELDKALYEVVYETRNRPDWVPVPLAAVERLLTARAGATGARDDAAADGGAAGAAPCQGGAMHSAADRRSPDPDALRALGRGEHALPHDVLGPHVEGGTVVVRTLRPLAQSVVLLTQDGARRPAEHEAEGVWVAELPGTEVPDYRLEVTPPGGGPVVVDDPYRFLPTIGELDLHLIGEGRHEQLWTVLGARVHRYPSAMGEVTGTAFAVWAPRARAVRVIGDFNGWDGRSTMMRALGSSGVWELFVPGVGVGTRYKYALLTQDGQWLEKADPLARASEVPPATASVVTESSYAWQDEAWLASRTRSDPHEAPMSIYEVHLGSWRAGLGYREAADALAEHVTATGFTHVELLPVAEHPFGGSWGYQVTGFYAPTARFGTPDDFRYLVDRLHRAGVGVIVDWVPAHFPKDAFALARFDGEPLYEYPDPRKGEHPDWGTLVFDYGRPQVRNFLVANALYWLEEFHVDGLRVDAVASMLYLDYSRADGQWVPNRYGGREHLEAIEFLQEVNATAYRRVPGIVTIAEESTAWPGVTRPTDAGGLGFGMKWNMGWMHDSLRYLAEEPIHRQHHHHEMTFAMVYAYSENYVLPISHDEVVHGKGSLLRKVPGDRWQQLATLRAFLAFMWAHPGKQLLFMGTEFGQEAEWAEARSLDWWLLDQPLHAGMLRAVSDLNRVYRGTPALWELDTDPAGFSWITADDAAHNTFAFVRRDASGRPLVCVVNFAGVPHEGYRLGLPGAGRWREVVNTDSDGYGGSGVGNAGVVEARPEPWSGQPASAELRVPPLGALWLVPEEWAPPGSEEAAAPVAAAPEDEAAAAQAEAEGRALAAEGLTPSGVGPAQATEAPGTEPDTEPGATSGGVEHDVRD
ncbi:1,4-alpha-glucan branching protein GlgB [Quadrisphaera sp. DSM 44207]|uniref:1,4-alpha-glucan branching protein GlgB n=1 Tax=Quadrisphaera sp. DSM 44207 TaxID=1881057 RepID=UPI000883A02C|nr:1,4-alpha-glucan branching protein GlgB [Quadrisphaera sp. DSM 44207]SDQ74047.1 1,4-alpha-glucan branching enzyme [Quadrisphaera sp. DSM 44207]